MKKTYIAPQSIAIEMQVESMIAASKGLNLRDESISGSGEIRTNRNDSPWSSSAWSEND